MSLFLKHSALFLVYLFLQVFVGNHATLFDVATPHLFLTFLLMLPMSTAFTWTILIAFFSGLTLDLLSDGLVKGVHAFSAVFLMSIRDFWVWGTTNRVNYRGSESTMLQVQTFPWYLQYMTPMVFIHQLVYYFLDAFTLDHAGYTMLRVVSSTVYTLLFVLSFTLLFHRETKR